MRSLGNYETYAMMAPWDAVPWGGQLIHGISPTLVEGVIELDTGRYADGTEISGPSAHSGVFQPSSTAWQNILAVLIGGPVTVN